MEDYQVLKVFFTNHYALEKDMIPKKRFKTSLDDQIAFIIQKVIENCSHPKTALGKFGLIIISDWIAINKMKLAKLINVSKNFITMTLNKQKTGNENPPVNVKDRLIKFVGTFQAKKFSFYHLNPNSNVFNLVSLHPSISLKIPQQNETEEYPTSPLVNIT